MIAIVDYGAGNLTSVRNAFGALGVETVATRDAAAVKSADSVVFPGVGAAGKAMENLRAMGLVEAVVSAARNRRFLGICLGMQILFDRTEEDGGVDCLGVVGGNVRRFSCDAGDKIPQIGWNDVEWTGPSPGEGSELRSREYYFVHSYFAEVVPETVGVSEYAGAKFTAMVRRGGFWACQFHPEKSGRAGMELLEEWLSC